MLCAFCGTDTKEWIKVGNIYVIIHHFCAIQAEEEKTDESGRRPPKRPNKLSP